MAGRQTNPIIALDGPSALALYRVRCEEESLGKPWYAAHVHAGAQVNVETTNEVFSDEDFWLSDEDVAMTMADAHVLGGSSGFASERTELDEDERLGRIPFARTRIRSFDRCVAGIRDVGKIELSRLGIKPASEGSPLFLLVSDSARRTRARGVHVRVIANRVPEGGLRRLGKQVLVPTPEFSFLLMAGYLSVVELVMVGMELCGYYRLAATPTSDVLASTRTLYGQRPLTTVARLQSFLSRAKGFPGLATALRACALLAQGSASPMETALYLFLCLPRRLGGYGLARPVLNGKRPVGSDARKLTFADVLIPDLYWPDAKLDVEYDSEAFHASAEGLRNGALRTLALRAMHVEVVALTKEVVRDAESFEVVARMIGKRLGTRWVPLSSSFYARRAELRETIFR